MGKELCMNSQCFRRGFLGTKIKELSLSRYNISVGPAAGSSTVTVYYGDEILKVSSGVTITKSGCITSASYDKSSGVVTINYGSNEDENYNNSGVVTINYNNRQQTVYINQDHDYLIEDGYSGAGNLELSTYDYYHNKSTQLHDYNGCIYLYYDKTTSPYKYYTNPSNYGSMAVGCIELCYLGYRFSKRKKYYRWASGKAGYEYGPEEDVPTEWQSISSQGGYGIDIEDDIFPALGLSRGTYLGERGGSFSYTYNGEITRTHNNVTVTIKNINFSSTNIGSSINFSCELGDTISAKVNNKTATVSSQGVSMTYSIDWRLKVMS